MQMVTDRHGDDLAAIALLDEPVRRRLYDLVVSRREPVGRDAAARTLGISRSLATFHLDRLAAAGLIETGYKRLTGRSGPGAGRPARIYWRATHDVAVSLPERRYDRAAELFAAALERIDGGRVPGPLLEAAERLGEDLARRAPTGGDATSRLIDALAEAGYEPSADDDGVIRLRNCPFHALVERHRDLVCGTNLALAEGIVRGAGAGEFTPSLDPQPGYCCVAFRAGERTREQPRRQLQPR